MLREELGPLPSWILFGCGHCTHVHARGVPGLRIPALAPAALAHALAGEGVACCPGPFGAGAGRCPRPRAPCTCWRWGRCPRRASPALAGTAPSARCWSRSRRRTHSVLGQTGVEHELGAVPAALAAAVRVVVVALEALCLSAGHVFLVCHLQALRLRSSLATQRASSSASWRVSRACQRWSNR